MSATRIKICGITRLGDAEVAVAAGADAIGLVFYAPSPRAVDLQVAQEIAQSVPAFVTVVGLFVDASAETVEQTLASVPLDLLQFHGAETQAFCSQFKRPWIKALRMKSGIDLAQLSANYAQARGILLDTWKEGVPGGTGTVFDWSLASGQLPAPIILAGGLTPENVRTAIDTVKPFAVDVSGGVESAPGIKDAQKIERFISAVRGADERL